MPIEAKLTISSRPQKWVAVKNRCFKKVIVKQRAKRLSTEPERSRAALR